MVNNIHFGDIKSLALKNYFLRNFLNTFISFKWAPVCKYNDDFFFCGIPNQSYEKNVNF